MKKCPFCARQTQDDTVKCPYCGALIKRPKLITFLGVVFLILFILSLVGALGASQANMPQGTPIDILLDIFFRILFLSTPFGLWYARLELLRLKNRGRILAIITLMVWSLALFVLGILELGHKGGLIKTTSEERISGANDMFIIVLFCILTVFYLTRPAIKEKFK